VFNGSIHALDCKRSSHSYAAHKPTPARPQIGFNVRGFKAALLAPPLHPLRWIYQRLENPRRGSLDRDFQNDCVNCCRTHWSLLDITFEALQALCPKLLIITQPVIDHAQRLGIQLTNPCGAFVFGHDQTDAAQQPKMFGDGRAAGAKIAGEFANRMLAVAQETEDFATGRIGDRPKYRLELFWIQNGHSTNAKPSGYRVGN